MVSEKVKTLVDTKIAGKKVMIFSKTTCPYCRKAKDVFKAYLGKDLNREDYEVMEIDRDPNCAEIQAYMQQKTGARSVPRVFINGKCIGGGDETGSLDKKGKLVPMFK